MSDGIAILNLIHLYAERVDAADFDAAAAMFADAEVTMQGKATQGAGVLQDFWRTTLRLHADGTPRTRHLVTNPIVEISPDGRTATARSCYTVLQATERTPLQIILSGRYQDAFEKVDGAWRFSKRVFGAADLRGDITDFIRA